MSEKTPNPQSEVQSETSETPATDTTPDAETADVETTSPETERGRPKVTIYNRSDVDMNDFTFKTAKQLESKLRRAERILVFDDPEDPEDPLIVHLRALTEKEQSILVQATLSKTDIHALVSIFLEKMEKKEDIQSEDVVDILAEKVRKAHDEQDVLEKMCRRIQMGTVHPRGTTIQWWQRKNPDILEICNDTLDDLQFENDLYILELASKEI